jgi:cytoskeletal protein RodZ
MANRDTHPISWFIIGVLVGIAATLGVLIWQNRTHEPDFAPAPAVRAAPPPAEPAPPPPKPKAATVPAPSRAASEADDQQVQEDAAAAGMTSRTDRNPPPQ